MRNIQAEEALGLLRNGEIQVVDVRTPQEEIEGVIPGGINLNMFSPDFTRKVQEMDREGVYLIYCRSGNRSRSVAGFMEKAGFTQVYNLEGGIHAWNQLKVTV